MPEPRIPGLGCQRHIPIQTKGQMVVMHGAQRLPKSKIAELMGVHASTVRRTLKNAYTTGSAAGNSAGGLPASVDWRYVRPGSWRGKPNKNRFQVRRVQVQSDSEVKIVGKTTYRWILTWCTAAYVEAQSAKWNLDSATIAMPLSKAALWTVGCCERNYEFYFKSLVPVAPRSICERKILLVCFGKRAINLQSTVVNYNRPVGSVRAIISAYQGSKGSALGQLSVKQDRLISASKYFECP